MHILLVTFELNGISEQAYAGLCAQIAPTYAALPGLISKLWLADAASNTYGGIYLWDNRAALDSYLRSPVFNGLNINPQLANFRARTFDSLDELTTITGGPWSNSYATR